MDATLGRATDVRPAAGHAPFTLRPIIKTMLRERSGTAPGSIFLVEDIQFAPVSQSGRWKTVQLLLGDGELCIQALLDGRLHPLVASREVAVGSYVRADDYSLKSQQIGGESEADGPSTMVYLIVGDLTTIGWNDSFRAAWLGEVGAMEALPAHSGEISLGAEPGLDDGEEITHAAKKEEDNKLTPVKQRSPLRSSPLRSSPLKGSPLKGSPLKGSPLKGSPLKDSPLKGSSLKDSSLKGSSLRSSPSKGSPLEGSPSKQQPPKSSYESYSDDAAIEDAFDAFDARTFPLKPNKNSPKKISTPAVTTLQESKKAATAKKAPVALPRDWHDPQTPLRLTTLHAVPRLPYSQNWSCNVLAIVVSLGEVIPSNLLPHRQRTARLADPSTAKLVTLTVFLDPEEFLPRIGSAVLLLGVKNHRSDGGSLKKYASDAGSEGEACGGRWWLEDPWELSWCDVGGITQWWSDMERSQPNN